MRFRLGLAIGGLGTAVVALAIAVVVLAINGGGDSTTTIKTPAMFGNEAAADESKHVVLGGENYAAPYGRGWGDERPPIISNGSGTAASEMTDIVWDSWGGRSALAWGKLALYRPGGGYYSRPGSVRIRASEVGRCEGRRAYLRLSIRAPSRRGGPLGPWRSWGGSENVCEAPLGAKTDGQGPARAITFQTPSENIGCRMTSDAVTCDIIHFAWSPPPVSAECEQPSAWGHTIVFKPSGSTFTCPDGPVVEPGPGTSALAYGQAVRVGPFACESRKSGLVCIAPETGHGFLLSVEKLRLS